MTLTSYPNANHLRDLSFSSYLTNDEQTYLDDLVQSSRNHTHTLPMMHYPRQKKLRDGEIEVFRADKYFNGGIDTEIGRRKQMGSAPLKPRIQPQTRSTRSESSWNSQTAFLRKDPALRNSRTSGKKLFVRSIKFSCCDSKSLEIDHAIPKMEETAEIETDTESDASSDLFEIECLSCYAPSVEWSVGTASAAAQSDTEDQQQLRGAGNGVVHVKKRRSAGILSGCRSEKALKVAGGSAYKITPAKIKP